MDDIKEKLVSSGMTISEYIRNLVMIDLGRFPIDIPKVQIGLEQEKRLLRAIKELEEGKGTMLSSRKGIRNHLDSLLEDD